MYNMKNIMIIEKKQQNTEGVLCNSEVPPQYLTPFLLEQKVFQLQLRALSHKKNEIKPKT